jgi:hypothetical protein
MIEYAFYKQPEPMRVKRCARKSDRELLPIAFTSAFYSLKTNIGTVIDIVPVDAVG